MWYLNEKTEERWAWAKVFTPEQCEAIIQLCENLTLKKSEIVTETDTNLLNEEYRKSNVAWLPTAKDSAFAWLYANLSEVVKVVNEQFFNYDLDYLENLQFTIYDNNGSHFSKHVDNLSSANKNRKLSFSVQLSASETYTGGDLLLYNGEKPTYASREQGTINFFPSWTLHEVTPIISGTRYSLVGWCHGPKFK